MSGDNKLPQRLIGVDPGSRFTGFGILDVEQQSVVHIIHGRIRLDPKQSFATRMGILFSEMCELIIRYKPTIMAIEKIFMARNPNVALKLGQAKGAILAAAERCGLQVYEYSTREIKQTLTGYGAASKAQVQYMVSQLLQLSELPDQDAADALATAICHSNHSSSKQL